MAFELGGRRGALRPSMNVTPLVDVVLVLLIIFMVVTPLLTKHLSLTVPGKSDDAPPPPSNAPKPPPSLVLTLDREGTVRLNSEALPREEVVPTLRRMLNARADKVVFFDARDDVPFSHAVELLDACRGGGIDLIAVSPEALAM